MYNALTTRDIEFSSNKSMILLRGGIVNRNQIINVSEDKIVVNDLTFAIAKRILKYSNVNVIHNGNRIFVKSGDEDALLFTYTDEAFKDERVECENNDVADNNEEIVENIKHIDLSDHVEINDSIDIEISSNNDISEENYNYSDDEVLDEDNSYVAEDDNYDQFDNNETDTEENTEVVSDNVIVRSHNSNRKNKKHHH